jgi:ferrous iron transport protein B
MPSKNDSYMMIDLPKYSLPTIGNTLNFANIKLFSFLKKATKFIVPLVFLLTILNNSQVSMKLYNSEKTPLEYVGRAITPILYPMGVKQENWQVSISIFSGLIAKEGAIATLASLYDLAGQEAESNTNLEYFIESIKNSLAVFINDLIYFNQIKIIDDANEEDVNMFSSIIPLFGISGALAYLIFIMMYAPCASVIGAMIQEAGAKWAWISFLWSNMLAYVTAILFYQVFNILDNPKSAILFIILAISLFYICFVYLKRALLVKNN